MSPQELCPVAAQWTGQGGQSGPLLNCEWRRHRAVGTHGLSIQPAWLLPSRHSWCQPYQAACSCPNQPALCSPAQVTSLPETPFVCISPWLPSTIPSSPTSKVPPLKRFLWFPTTTQPLNWGSPVSLFAAVLNLWPSVLSWNGSLSTSHYGYLHGLISPPSPGLGLATRFPLQLWEHELSTS